MNVPTERKISIMHACRWQTYRNGVKLALAKKENIEFIGEAANGKELLELLKIRKPDIIILDINMPIMDGLQTLPVLKENFPDIRVIILTMYSHPLVIIKTLELGANAFLTADAGADDVYDAIISSFESGIYLNVGVRQSLNRSFERLRADEIKIIKFMAQNISAEISAQELGLSVRTINAIIEKLIKMADVSTSEELIVLARKKGFIEDEVVHPKIREKLPFWRRLRFA